MSPKGINGPEGKLCLDNHKGMLILYIIDLLNPAVKGTTGIFGSILKYGYVTGSSYVP